MKVAIETTTAMSHGLRSPAAERLFPAARRSRPRLAHRTFTIGTTDMPGPSTTSGGWSKHDLDRHPLHHLHVVAGGILGRQAG